MPICVIRNWFDSKRFGCIIPDQGDADVFVHRHALEDVTCLTPGDAVTYAYAWNGIKHGWMAVSIGLKYSRGEKYIMEN